VGGGNGDARRVNFQGVVGRTPSLWLFTRAETHAAYLVCTIVQNDARGKIFAARDFTSLSYSPLPRQVPGNHL
jgi:hypothetical protein